MKPLITYVVCCYNEKDTIVEAINDVKKIKIKNKEIIVIDNCSTDGTRKILKNYKKLNKNKNLKIILNPKNLGAKTFLIGRKKAKGKYIFLHHADREYDHLKSVKMIKIAEENNLDVIFGSRLKNLLTTKSYYQIIKSNYYFIGTIISTFIFNFLFKTNFTDIIGVKLYKKKSINKIKHSTTHQHGFEFNFTSNMVKKNLKIKEVNIKYTPRKFGSKSIKWYHLFLGIYYIILSKFT